MKAAMITQQARSQFREVPIKLPLFFSRAKSPRSFASTAVVGLGIVAAMGNSPETPKALTSAAVPTRSDPIPISPAALRWDVVQPEQGAEADAEAEEEELSESYTCVISHVGKGYARKRVYCTDGTADYMDMNMDMGMDMDMDMDMDMNLDAMVLRSGGGERAGLFYQSSPATPVAAAGFEFLKFCCRCRKSLEGIDIFMYRGEKAFCSADCRYHQIVADEYHEKFGSKSLKPFDCSASPCSAPMLLAAGVAAA